VYPFEPAGAVVDKLDFVHARITASGSTPDATKEEST
jgi:hypothetical protein